MQRLDGKLRLYEIDIKCCSVFDIKPVFLYANLSLFLFFSFFFRVASYFPEVVLNVRGLTIKYRFAKLVMYTIKEIDQIHVLKRVMLVQDVKCTLAEFQ